ncbi:MAG TPA: hypothetical protein VJ784_19345 [Pyrinomonadaceae bacterium]|nr:hypothetical protein [Pyrinomonadaceae bacterium]
MVDWARGSSHQLKLAHGVDRIEQMGTDAVIVGSDGKDLHFSAVRLGAWPEIVSRYTGQGASQGEQRSHGFFYSLTVRIRECWVYRSACRVEQVTSICSKAQPRFCSCETTHYNFEKLVSWARSLRGPWMIGVARRVLIGMEMRDRCFYAGECLRCSVTKSSRVGWMTGGCMKYGA